MNKLLLIVLILLSLFNIVLAQDEGDLSFILWGVGIFFAIIVIGVVVFLILKRGKKKKSKLSIKSINFAKLVKSLCFQSGINIELQLKATKMIAHDFIDAPGRDIYQFLSLPAEQAKNYLKKTGMADLDAEIFFSILTSNKDEFMML